MGNEVQEDFEVSVREIKENIKDISYNINLFEGNTQSLLTTEIINGILKALILETSNPIYIKISLLNYPDIAIFEEIDYNGSYYIPLAISPISKSAKVFNYSPHEWTLNDQLKIEISGQKDTEINLVIRYI